MEIIVKFSKNRKPTPTNEEIFIFLSIVGAIIGGTVVIKNEFVKKNLYSESIIYSMPVIWFKGIIGMIIGAFSSVLSPIIIPAFVWYHCTKKTAIPDVKT